MLRGKGAVLGRGKSECKRLEEKEVSGALGMDVAQHDWVEYEGSQVSGVDMQGFRAEERRT